MREDYQWLSICNSFMSASSEWFEREFPEGRMLKVGNGIYTPALIILMMVVCRVMGNVSFSSMMKTFVKKMNEIPDVKQFVYDDKNYKYSRSHRVELDYVSDNTGGIVKATKRVPLEKVESLYDGVVSWIMETQKDLLLQERYFIIDGTTTRLEASKELCENFYRRQGGSKEHYPKARVLLATDLNTGVSIRPEVGDIKSNEQALAKGVIGRMPLNSTILGDANFGTFSVACVAKERGHKVIFRMQSVRAQKIMKDTFGKNCDNKLSKDGEWEVKWKASERDVKADPTLKGKELKGRLISHTNRYKGMRDLRFIYFVTTEHTPEQTAHLYEQRWNVEVDIKTLKQLGLDALRSKTTDGIKKELLTGFIGYNLVRLTIARIAKKASVSPRKFSFTQVLTFIGAIGMSIVFESDIIRKDRLIQVNIVNGYKNWMHPTRSKVRREPRCLMARKSTQFPVLEGTRKKAKETLSKKLG